MTDVSTAHDLAEIVVRALAKGTVVEIDGLGIFYPDPAKGCRFEPRRAQFFIAYVEEDRGPAAWLCAALENQGFSPWMDIRKLMPGQNWPRAIEAAIETSDFFWRAFRADRWASAEAFSRDSLRARLRAAYPAR